MLHCTSSQGIRTRSALYRVIVRGNQRRKTFLGGDDYKTYLERLEKYRTQFRVRTRLSQVQAADWITSTTSLRVKCLNCVKPAGR